ncbi:hypothetical protein QN289_03955 [Latilactobacillus curvatus]|uniref:hypothetical protein n=1 Tax=Latilactobacillus curvatus TaxID=28038 RepID=UPI0024DF9CFC|nr:hypothetical protein [Latilactobacillus curvatus]WIE01521.1 hypothetical protein QN289_03955 [Latilactobacillus curvatus]
MKKVNKQLVSTVTKWVKLNWDKIITVLLSTIAIIFSGITFYKQSNEKQEYTDSARIVMLNSLDSEIDELEFMFSLIIIMPKITDMDTANIEDLANQIEENYKLTENLDISKFQVNQLGNYQSYKSGYISRMNKVNEIIKEIKESQGQQDMGDRFKTYCLTYLTFQIDSAKDSKKSVLENKPLKYQSNNINDKKFENKYKEYLDKYRAEKKGAFNMN